MKKPIQILLVSDIHGNFPALEAIAAQHPPDDFYAIFNSGDSTVYCPFPNETLSWLQKYKVHSIRGNTDDKVRMLLKGKTFKKPSKPEKRIMYTSTAEELSEHNRAYMLGLKKKYSCTIKNHSFGLYHGSPAEHEEFLFADTPRERFEKLAKNTTHDVIITGHSHSPYHKLINGVHFINPGSAGRMFDGNPQASYAILTIKGGTISVEHHRLTYDIDSVIERISQRKLPAIYKQMYRTGKKLN